MKSFEISQQMNHSIDDTKLVPVDIFRLVSIQMN